MKKIACEHPNIIFNPNLKWLFSKCKFAKLAGHQISYRQTVHVTHRFPWHEFYAAKNAVQGIYQSTGEVSQCDDYFMVDDDGVVYPVFMLVPCGKCCLCHKKYIRDWETRCICESASSPFPPLFITLTYRPDARPADMDQCKRDFQLFMKRLRISVSRDLGVKNQELRYIFVSEYTPKNHYPHLHGLLWNMPYVAAQDGAANSFQALVRFIESAWSNGYIKVEQCRDKSGAYCLKYIKKGSDGDCFMVASRRRGIGYKFAESLWPTILKHPDITSITVPIDGKCSDYAIPTYFKRLWFPTLSLLFPQKVTNAAKSFVESVTRLNYALREYMPSVSWLPMLPQMVESVANKYGLMHIDFDDAYPDRRFCSLVRRCVMSRDADGSTYVPDVGRVKDFRCYPDEYFNPITTYTLRSNGTVGLPRRIDPYTHESERVELRRQMIADFLALKESYTLLMDYKFSADYIISRLQVTAAHQEYVRALMDDLPEPNVSELVTLAKIDDEWMDTHWRNSDFVDCLQ